MPNVQPISDTNNKSSKIKTVLAAEATGAAAGVGMSYLLQKTLFRHADRFIPITKENARNLGHQGVKTDAFHKCIDFLNGKQINNKELLFGALKGMFWVTIGGALYGMVKRITGNRDENLDKKTGIAAGIGAAAGALMNVMDQNYAIHKLGFMKKDALEAAKLAAKENNKRLVTDLSKSVQNIKEAIGNGKIIKSFSAIAAAKGAFAVAGLYLLFKGIKESFHRPKYARPVVIAHIPDEETMKAIAARKAAQSK